MDISDIIFSPYLPSRLKRAVFEFIEDHDIHDPSLQVVIPCSTNDDVNGSQHAPNGGTDFSYEDASEDQIRNASTLGYYEDFRIITPGLRYYTGNQYHGEGNFFAALVIDPPAYAATAVI